MKKQISMLFAVLASGALASSFAYADTGTVPAGGTVTVGSTANGATIASPATVGCVVLASNVKIGTSTNVNGGYDCRAGTATTPAAIGVATCHTAGLVKSKTYTCTAVDLPVTGCTAPVAGSPAPTKAVDGGSAYYALTTGGSVASTPLGATTCNSAGVLSVLAPLVDAGLAAAAR